MKKINNSAFTLFFIKFPKLLLGGILFSIPFALLTTLFAFISKQIGFNNVILWGLSIIPTTPFYAGLTMIARKYAIEKLDVPIFLTFFSSVKENWKKFLVHGVVLYLITACSFFAILYYYTLAKDDAVFGSVLTIYLLFTAILLVMMFYVPIMTVTYDLKLIDIYKNSFLLVFGKILRNLIAILVVCVELILSILLIVQTEGILFVVVFSLYVAILPLIITYTIISIISKGLQDTVGDFVNIENNVVLTREEIEYEKEVIDSVGNESDYVFVNGKMIKNPSKK